MHWRSRLAVVLTVLTGLGFTTAAGALSSREPARVTPTPAKTFILSWVERHSSYGRHFVMTFTIDWVRIGRGGWAAGVFVANDSYLDVRVGRRFGLVADSGSDGRIVLPAMTFDPSLPRSLGPMERWIGIIRGDGTPPKGSRVRLRFGDFRVGIATNLVITHVTRHSFRW